MEDLFRNNTEDTAEFLNSKRARDIIKNTLEVNGKFSKNKKEMQKIIVKEYLNYINEIKDEVFDNLGIVIKQPTLEKIALFAKYNKSLTVADFVKSIKKIDDLSLEEVIRLENDFGTIGMVMLVNRREKESSEELSRIESAIREVDILSLTLKLVKYIKHDYLSYNISYFDKNGKPKKVLVDKTLYPMPAGFYMCDKSLVSMPLILDYLNMMHSQMDKNIHEYNIEEYISNYMVLLDSFYDVLGDEYSKLILSEKYLTYINNRITNPVDAYKSVVVMSVFYNRKVLIPNSGVLILVKDDCIIESILLKEIYKFDRNNFVAITRYKDGSELINIFDLGNSAFKNRVCKRHREEEDRTIIKYIADFLESSQEEKDLDLNYDVLSPTYWKYRNRGYKSENDEVNLKGVVIRREFEVEIAPFIRKINGKASKEAIDMAKRLGVILEDGYTIVKPHTRKYNAQKQ